MPRSFVLHREPNWKNPKKSRSLHHRGSNDPRASRGAKPREAAKWKSNVQMTPGAWEEEGSNWWKVQATWALLPAPQFNQCVTQASCFRFCLPQFPHVQHREAGDCSQDTSLLPGFGTAARRGLKALLQRTGTQANQSAIGVLWELNRSFSGLFEVQGNTSYISKQC